MRITAPNDRAFLFFRKRERPVGFIIQALSPTAVFISFGEAELMQADQGGIPKAGISLSSTLSFPFLFGTFFRGEIWCRAAAPNIDFEFQFWEMSP